MASEDRTRRVEGKKYFNFWSTTVFVLLNGPLSAQLFKPEAFPFASICLVTISNKSLSPVTMSKIYLEYILSSLYSFELQGDQSYRKLILNIHWRDWYWGWSSNTLATWCEESTHWKNPWSWERLKAGGEGDDRGWNGWIASPTQWTWVWASSGDGEGQGNLVCCSMGSQRLGQDWETE